MSDNIFKRGHTCPWWFCWVFDNPLRRLFHNPRKMLSSYVNHGDWALDLGCGMGYFTLGLAELVGETGHVIAVDLQEKMLAGVWRRVERAGWQSRVQLHLGSTDKIGVSQAVDFVLAFWMVHEVMDQETFLSEIYDLIKPDGNFFLVEPKIHVSEIAFAAILDQVHEIGFQVKANPEVYFSRAVLLTR